MDKFMIEKKIGEGAYGAVYKVKGIRDHKIFAVKEIRNIGGGYGVLKEYRILQKLDHSNIVKYYDVFFEGGSSMILMEYIEGISLAEYMKLQFPEPTQPDLVLNLAKLFLTALEYLSQHQIAHRDVKPSNIMYDPSMCRFVLVDFGTVCLIDECKSWAGSPRYMSPEMILLYKKYISLNEISKEDYFLSDVFSLGLVLLFLSQGKETKNQWEEGREARRKLKLKTILKKAIDPIIYYDIVSKNEKLQNLLRAMLKYNCKERPSASRCLATYF